MANCLGAVQCRCSFGLWVFPEGRRVYHSSWLEHLTVNLFVYFISVNKHDHFFLKQYSDQSWEPCKDAGGNLGILYCQWCQRGQKVFMSYSELKDSCLSLGYWCHMMLSSWYIHVHLYAVFLSEHISTAKLVMMTSQIPKGSKSVAARDVSTPGYPSPFTFHWSLHRIQLCTCKMMFVGSVWLLLVTFLVCCVVLISAVLI